MGAHNMVMKEKVCAVVFVPFLQICEDLCLEFWEQKRCAQTCTNNDVCAFVSNTIHTNEHK